MSAGIVDEGEDVLEINGSGEVTIPQGNLQVSNNSGDAMIVDMDIEVQHD